MLRHIRQSCVSGVVVLLLSPCRATWNGLRERWRDPVLILVLIGRDGKVKNYWEGEVSKPDLEAAIQVAYQH
jgi:hypothetical protein